MSEQQALLAIALLYNRIKPSWQTLWTVLGTRFFKDGATLAAGSVLTQSLAIFTAPVMARLYDPAAYGLLGLFIAIYGILTVPATLQYHQAVILPNDDEDARAIIKGGLGLGLITSLLCALLCFLPLTALTLGTEYAAIVPWTPLMALMVLPGCFTTFASSWLARKQQFRELTISRILINGSSTAVGMTLGFCWPSVWGLLVANALGALLGAFVLAIAMNRSGGMTFYRAKMEQVITQLKLHRGFPLYSTPTQLFSQISRQAPVLLLNGLSGQKSVGFFNMSNRLLGLPNALFAQSLSEVFRQRAAKQYAETGECFDLYWKMAVGLSVSVVPMIAFLAWLAPDLFAILLGEKWRVAGDYSRILCLSFAAQLVADPLSSMMVIAQKQREDFIVQVLTTVLIAVLMWFSYLVYGTAISMLVGYSVGNILMCVYYTLRGFRLAKGRVNKADGRESTFSV